jgi:hypothetical protein
VTGKILVIHEGAEFKTFPRLPVYIKWPQAFIVLCSSLATTKMLSYHHFCWNKSEPRTSFCLHPLIFFSLSSSFHNMFILKKCVSWDSWLQCAKHIPCHIANPL